MSVSAYITQMARRSTRPALWPEEFRDLYGTCTLDLPEDPPPEDLPHL